ncbi:MAG: hypothetical protein RL685_421 [Pseudomonadota bacterium]
MRVNINKVAASCSGNACADTISKRVAELELSLQRRGIQQLSVPSEPAGATLLIDPYALHRGGQGSHLPRIHPWATLMTTFPRWHASPKRRTAWGTALNG